tara:strand:+ start:2561 stop:2767 length:207 start_codon:yes stop_codon:yes gene_type:complete
MEHTTEYKGMIIHSFKLEGGGYDCHIYKTEFWLRLKEANDGGKLMGVNHGLNNAKKIIDYVTENKKDE